MAKKYSAAEIDAMRRLLENKYLFGAYSPRWGPGGSYRSRSYMEADKIAFVENGVRTHMMAGHRAKDLVDD